MNNWNQQSQTVIRCVNTIDITTFLSFSPKCLFLVNGEKKTTNKNIDLVDLESKSGNKVMHSNFIRLNKQQILDSSKL